MDLLPRHFGKQAAIHASDGRMLMQASKLFPRLSTKTIQMSLVRKVATMMRLLAWTSWLKISTQRFRAN